MTSGVPTSGRRAPRENLHRRWTPELLAPLHKRWLAGEKLDAIAKPLGTTRGRLRRAFAHYGFNETPTRQRPNSDHVNSHVVFEAWKPRRDFDATLHREARHYKGSFDL